MQKINIADKINLCYVNKTKFKTNYFKVSFVIDLDRKYASKLSLLSALLLRASKNYPSIASLNDRLDYLYDMNVSSGVSKRGERLFFDYDCDFLRSEFLPEGEENLLEMALCMFEEIVFNPLVNDGAFDEKMLECEKTELENIIKSRINYKRSYVKEMCIKTMCEGEKFEVSPNGELEDIPLVTPTKLYEFYKELLSIANIEIVFVGDADIEFITSRLKQIFSKIENRRPAELCKTYITGDARSEALEKCEQMQISQGNLALGFRTGVALCDKDAMAMNVLRDIYGGSATSRLFVNVREKMSLCYYCGAATDLYKGIMIVLSGIQSENKQKAQAAILNELYQIQKGNVCEDDLVTAKLNLANSYKSMDDNPSAIAYWYINRRFEGIDRSIADELEMIQNVTVSDVVDVSKKIKLDTVYFLKGQTEEEVEA